MNTDRRQAARAADAVPPGFQLLRIEEMPFMMESMFFWFFP